MPITQDPAILGAIKGRRKATDEITRILNSETKPTGYDRAEAMLRDVSSAARGKGLNFETPQDIFNQRMTKSLAPSLTAFDIANKTIEAGGPDAKAIMESFSKFTDNPDDLARLWSAAESDQEEITPLNAATFAARKAQELGFKSVQRMQAENQKLFGEARLAEIAAKANKDGGLSWLGDTNQPAPSVQAFDAGLNRALPSATPTPVSGVPSDANLVQGRGTLLPPTASGTEQPDFSLFQGATGEQAPTVTSNQPANLRNVKGVQVDLNLFPQGIENARTYKNDKELRDEANKFLNDKEIFATYIKPGNEANSYINKIEGAEKQLDILQSQGKSTGQLQAIIGRVFNQSQIEGIAAAKAGLAMAARVPGTGAVSNFDAQRLEDQVMGDNKSMAFNRMWATVTKGYLKNAKDFKDFFDWYTRSFGPNFNEASSVWEEFRKQNPMTVVDKNNIATVLPGYNANWREWVAGKRTQTPSNNEDISWVDNLSPEDKKRALELMNMRGGK